MKFKPLATGTQCAESGFHVNNVKTERNTHSNKKKNKTAVKQRQIISSFACVFLCNVVRGCIKNGCTLCI